ncbi:MAG: thrombospondin type 3 repeat-containing protein [Gammaproteobacteria bacterium]|nr:thrombospondin type 3 repeat-containing protein [Gammaproteobacteria bacterium]
MKSLVTVLVGLCFSSPLAAFNVSSNYWLEGQVEFNVNFPDRHASANPLPTGSASLESLQTEFVRSMNEWNDESAFKFIIDTATPSVDPCGASGNGVQFAPDNCGSAFGSSTLAIQTEFFIGTKRVRSTINFNSTRTWDIFSGSMVGKVDFRRVALHELGHSVGLDHEDDGTPTIMTTFAGSLRALQLDDIAGAAFLYDVDSDGFGFADDNCPTINNADQADQDNDGEGNLCDPDIDGDGVFNDSTNDQQFAFSDDQLASSGFSFGDTGTNGYLAQTFTIGLTGHLESVSLPITCASGDLQVEIRGTGGTGSPLSANLDSKTLAVGPVSSSFTEIDLNDFDVDDLSVASGDVLAVVVYSTGDCFWPIASSGSYNFGQGYFSTNGSTFLESASDRPFAIRVRPAQVDNCPLAANPDQADSDMDGEGDVCDLDTNDADNDNVADSQDNCPAIANEDQADADGDGVGDACDAEFNDQDADMVGDALDNCPADSNADQSDLDVDGLGDVCDLDDDADSVLDVNDNCPIDANSDQADSDGDGAGDSCDLVFNDQDADLVGDALDNCPLVANPDQADSDMDSQGDACDTDDDNDGVIDSEDNCPLVANALQEDVDSDDVGDACEPTDEGICFPVPSVSKGVAIICL